MQRSETGRGSGDHQITWTGQFQAHENQEQEKSQTRTAWTINKTLVYGKQCTENDLLCHTYQYCGVLCVVIRSGVCN